MSCLSHLIQPSGLLWVPAMRWCSVPVLLVFLYYYSVCCVLRLLGPVPMRMVISGQQPDQDRGCTGMLSNSQMCLTARHLVHQTRTHYFFVSTRDACKTLNMCIDEVIL